jgi:hypothetical protein
METKVVELLTFLLERWECGLNTKFFILASDGAPNDAFGNTISIVDNTIVIGAFRSDTPNARFDSGSVYIFFKNDTTNLWLPKSKTSL